MNNLYGIIFAYYSAPMLRELVAQRTAASLPFAGRYRTIDFMLSNMVNAGAVNATVLLHDQYQSLMDHLGSGKAWEMSRKHGGLKTMPPFAYAATGRTGSFRGRMDALAGVHRHLKSIREEYVVLTEGDMVLNLDLGAVLTAHVESGADITAVCSPRHLGESTRRVYFKLQEDGRVCDVAIRPTSPDGYESLEIYILSRTLLLELVEHCAARGLYSFGEDVLQGMRQELTIRAHLFSGYVARMDSIAAYFARSMEMLDPEIRKELFAPERPIRTQDRSDPATYYGPEAKSVNSLVADGCVIEGEIENCILFRGVRIGQGARLRDCIVMTDSQVGPGAELRYVIADKNVMVQANRTLYGHDSYPLTIEKETTV